LRQQLVHDETREPVGAPAAQPVPPGAPTVRLLRAALVHARRAHEARRSVKAFADCGAELALGHHYGTFQLTDEAIDAPLQALDLARKAAGVTTRERFRTLSPGEVWKV
jgi:hypothetical protein